jgi:hypothetical protein
MRRPHGLAGGGHAPCQAPDGYDVAGAHIAQVGRRTQIILIGTALTALAEEQSGRQAATCAP